MKRFSIDRERLAVFERTGDAASSTLKRAQEVHNEAARRRRECRDVIEQAKGLGRPVTPEMKQALEEAETAFDAARHELVAASDLRGHAMQLAARCRDYAKGGTR